MTNHRLKDLRGNERRNFLRWIGIAGAAVALERSKLLNFLADEGGSALADEMCPSINRSVHLIGGNGSFAWMHLLWPHIAVAEANDGSMANLHAGDGTIVAYGGQDATLDKKFYYAPEAPWRDSVTGMPKPKRAVTAFMCGKDETHTKEPKSAATVGSGRGMIATVAAMQAAVPSVVPVIGVEPFDFGDAPGTPSVATVSSAAGLVELFNSKASQLTLAAQEDAALFETYYKAFLGVRYAAGRPSWKPHIDITKKAAQLIGFNFKTQLDPTPLEGAFGITTLNQSGALDIQKEKLSDFGRAMATAAKAMKLGLTNCVIIAFAPGATNDDKFTDPHAVFNNPTAAQATVKGFGDILNGFYAELEAEPVAPNDPPPCSNVVLTAHGDTPKNPLVASGWPDATPQGCNWLYVMGNGHLAEGWFGGVKTDGSVDGFNPTTGEILPNVDSVVDTAAPAGAAVAYAVSGGNMNLVKQYYQGPPIDKIVR